MRHENDRDRGNDQTPLVGRPRGAAWRALQADGVVWEGQVFLIGLDVDLAARLIVTQRRLALARGGDVVLEVPRAWLRPAPLLRRDGTVLLSISSPDADVFAEPETFALRMRDGHPAAGHLVALLAGSGARLLPPEPLFDDFVPGVLPPLPEPARPAPATPDRWSAPPPTFPTSPPPLLAADDPIAPGTLEPVVRPAPPPAAGRDRDWNLKPVKGMVPHAARRRRGWALRLGGLVLLLATAAAIGSATAPTRRDDRAADADLPAATRRPVATTIAQAPPPTASAEAAMAAHRTALALGVGGAASASAMPTLPPSTAAPTLPPPTAVPTSPPDPTPPPVTTVPTVPPPTAAPTDPPSTATDERGATDQPAPTAQPVPTAEPTTAPEPTEPPAPTSVPVPTEPPPTVEPRVAAESTAVPAAPPTLEPTATPPPTSTAVPSAEPAQTPAAPPAADGGEPAATNPDGPLRYTVEEVQRGAALRDFGLSDNGGGDWVAAILRVENASDQTVELAMADLALRVDTGEVVALDGSTRLAAEVAGLDPAFGAEDVVRLRPGQERRLALIFLVPPAADGLTLLAGREEIALDQTPAGADPDAGSTAAAPDDLVEASVAEVLDAARIAVVLNGERRVVRYLGIEAPTGDECYATEATAANAALVGGKAVWLEREDRNADPFGRLLRHVWVAGPNGDRLLVAAELVARGAAVPASDDLPARHADRLAAAAETAEAGGIGLWGACAAEASGVASVPVAGRLFVEEGWHRRLREGAG